MYDIFFDLENLHELVGGDECWGIPELDQDEEAQLELLKLANTAPQVFGNGCNCKECGEHYPYAEPNQKDGSLICYSCRKF